MKLEKNKSYIVKLNSLSQLVLVKEKARKLRLIEDYNFDILQKDILNNIQFQLKKKTLKEDPMKKYFFWVDCNKFGLIHNETVRGEDVPLSYDSFMQASF